MMNYEEKLLHLMSTFNASYVKVLNIIDTIMNFI